jgi:hypothetical protein
MMPFAENWSSGSAAQAGSIAGELSTDKPPEPPTPAGRQAERVPVEFGAGLRQRGAAGVSIQVMDLSTHGFRAATHLELCNGTDVWLRLPGLEPCHARVVWSEGHFVGCAFERPLHPAVLAMIVQKSQGR